MTKSTKSSELREILAGFLCGDSLQYRLIRNQISRFVARRCSGLTTEKDDLVSEIIRILLENLRNGKFRGNDLKSFNAYIYGIARLTIMRAIRDERKEKESVGDANPEEIADRGNPDILRAVANRDLLQAIYGALDPGSRELLKLKFEEGLSNQEIADRMKKSRNAVSTAISRCIDKTRSLPVVTEFLYKNRGDGHSSS